MRQGWLNNHQARLEDLAHQVKALLNFADEHWAPANNRVLWIEVVKRKPKWRNGRRKTHRVMDIENTSTPSTSDKSAHLTMNVWTKVIHLFALAPLSNDDGMDFYFLDCGIYFQIYFGNYVTSIFHYLKKNTHSVKAYSCNYQSGFGKEGDRWRQMPCPASRDFSPHNVNKLRWEYLLTTLVENEICAVPQPWAE